MFSHGWLKRTQRFGLTGLLVTAVHVAVAIGAIRLIDAPPALANGLAFIVATFLSYLLNTVWTFSRPVHGKNIGRFFVVSGAGFALAVSVSGVAELVGAHQLLGILAVACVVPPMTFLFHTRWTYA